ncbi:uncharacterized protein FIESC28_07417 [Fusarium coffeatum]|uniref:Uncharacterized protein n=1 Tax=Fusarium coffeatum TaxID=231269 RepID=A0A366RD84_9HYPO|nr:uncharacterized protein FIESC28_07417 [Fusarium coffeatum]RBR15101.1 hypothetical protein FIESC28_07417 [Fusarium coffeatum]
MRPLPKPEWMPKGYYGKIPSIITSIRQLPEGSQWENYIEFLKTSVEMDLESLELSTLLMPHIEWAIIEDRDTLDNASKQQVREKFSEWTSQRSVERDGPRVEEAFQYGIPRFRYCIYVDQKCLDTVNQYKA